MVGFVEISKSYIERGETEVERDIKRLIKETAFRNILPVDGEDILVSSGKMKLKFGN